MMPSVPRGFGEAVYDGAQVLPVVAEVEDVSELLAEPQSAQPRFEAVQGSFPLVAVPGGGRADRRAVGDGQLVEVVAVPASERVVDCRGALLEGGGTGGLDRARCRSCP
jgi:hypothetical protein